MECNHNYQLTKEFLKSKNIENDKVFDWFKEQGEILYNIEERFEK